MLSLGLYVAHLLKWYAIQKYSIKIKSSNFRLRAVNIAINRKIMILTTIEEKLINTMKWGPSICPLTKVPFYVCRCENLFFM